MTVAVPALPYADDQTTRYAIAGIGLYLVGKMFYVFGGGSIQPADGLLALVAIFIAQPQVIQQLMLEQRPLVLFVGWVQVVNLGWAAYASQLDFILYSSFYLFNLLIVACVFGARNRNPDLFDRHIVRWLQVSIVIQFVFVYFGHSAGRSMGTYNNPNQLSYWVVCTLGLLMVVRRNNATVLDLPFILLGMWCQIGSASRAGVGATFMLVVIWAFFALKTPLKRVMGLLAAVLMLIGLTQTSRYAAFNERSARIATAEQRLIKEDGESQLDIRNYSRITRFFQYTVVGAGEGYFRRFVRSADEMALEIHSSFGTVFFCYGIVGIVLFLLFLGRLWMSLELSYAVYIIPPMAYGLTHQGLRFSFFWILIGVLASIASQRRSRSALPAPVAAAPAAPRPVVAGFAPRGRDYLDRIARERDGGRRTRSIAPGVDGGFGRPE